MAARTRPSRWLAGSPASWRAMVTGRPAGLPAGVTIQVRQRRGQLQLQASAAGIPPDGLVPQQLARLAVSGEEHPRRLPPLPPPLRAQPGRSETVPLAEQVTPAPAHAHPPSIKLPFRLGQTGAQRLETLLPAVPLRLADIAAGAATTNGVAISRNRPLTPRPRGSNS